MAKKIENLEELTIKDIIETLVTYDIEHCRFPHNYFIDTHTNILEMHGLALDDKKLILINKEQPTEIIRQVIIHELLHTKHYRLGDLSAKETEKRITAETIYNYVKLYGVKI